MPDEQQLHELSIVLLCYKAGESIHGLVNQLVKLLNEAQINDFELVLVGNYMEGSDDSTPQAVQALAKEYPYIRTVIKPKQGWMGWDMQSGLAAAKGKYVAVTDGDGQMPMEDIVRVYQTIKEGDYDFVKTYRETRGDGLQRKLISFFYNILFNSLFPGLKSRDVNAKPKIFKREAYQQLELTSTDWFIDAEIMIQARRLKFKIKELPTNFRGLVGRRSFISLSTSLEFIKNLIIYRIREFKVSKKR